jgi:hypothetical protein
VDCCDHDQQNERKRDVPKTLARGPTFSRGEGGRGFLTHPGSDCIPLTHPKAVVLNGAGHAAGFVRRRAIARCAHVGARVSTFGGRAVRGRLVVGSFTMRPGLSVSPFDLCGCRRDFERAAGPVDVGLADHRDLAAVESERDDDLVAVDFGYPFLAGHGG